MAQRRTTNTKIELTEHKLTLTETLRLDRLAPASEVDPLAVHGRLRKPFRTGTLVAYETPNKGLGTHIEFDGIAFPVPRDHQGMKNVALVTHSYTIHDGVLRVRNVELVPGFPSQEGWHHVDANGIPHGRVIDPSDDNTRYLLRRSGAYIGTVARDGHRHHYGTQRYIHLNYGIDHPLLVARNVSELRNGPVISQSVVLDPALDELKDAIPGAEGAMRSLGRPERTAVNNLVRAAKEVLRVRE